MRDLSQLCLMIALVCLIALLPGCSRKYEVHNTFHFTLPQCAEGDTECLEALKELTFEKLVNIEVDADVEKKTDAGVDLTGGKIW